MTTQKGLAFEESPACPSMEGRRSPVYHRSCHSEFSHLCHKLVQSGAIGNAWLDLCDDAQGNSPPFYVVFKANAGMCQPCNSTLCSGSCQRFVAEFSLVQLNW